MMPLVILVDWSPDDGWFVQVMEGTGLLVEQGGYPSALLAMEAGQVWVTLHWPGLPCITEVRSAPDGVVA
jgi:hypothetical protein